jgi:hypothetical protein
MPDSSQLRRRLKDLLRTDADLDAFCHDFFPGVHERFTDGMDRLRKVNLLLNLADPAEILASLEKYKPGAGPAQVPTTRSPVFLVMTLGASALLLASLFFLWTRPLRCLVHHELCEQKPSIEHEQTAPAPSLPPELIELPITSDPSGAKVWSADNAPLCDKTPCNPKVPAHAPLELRFESPGFEHTFTTKDTSQTQQTGGVHVTLSPSHVPR